MRSHNTVDVVVGNERMSATSIRGKVQPAEENIAEVDVEAAADGNEMNERNVHYHKFDLLNYLIVSVVCNLEQVTETPFLCGQ